MNSATTTAAVKSAGEARPSRFVKYSFTSESEPELAKSSDEESSAEAEAGRARPSRKETVEVATMVPRETRATVDCPAALGCTSNSGMAGERIQKTWKPG